MSKRSAPSSPASAASTSASSARGCESSGKSSKTPTAVPSSSSTSPRPSASRTSARLERAISRASIFSAEASRARISAAQERERALPAPTRVFGSSLPDSFANFDPATSLWRTSPASSAAKASAGTELPSDEFLATYPKWGMTRSGRCFQLESSGHPTCASESGLLPTPVANDDGKSPRAHLAMKARLKGGTRRQITSLAVLARAGFPEDHGRALSEELFPTPTTADSREGRNATAKRSPGSRHHSGRTLVDHVTLFPTPRAGEAKHARRSKPAKAGQQKGLAEAVGSGKLNPTWVEWLMGFPLGWTALPPSATPSSRRSRSGSDRASSSTSDDAD